MDEINFESELNNILAEDFSQVEITEEDFPLFEEPTREEPQFEDPTRDAPQFEETQFEEPQFEEPQQKAVVRKSPREKKDTSKKRTLPKVSIKLPAIKKPAPKNAAPRKVPSSSAEKPKAAGAYPRRRPRMTKLDRFKQNILPLIILAVAAILIVIFIIGSITRAVQKKQIKTEASIAVSESIALEQARLEAEMAIILKDADLLAESYDYDGAIALIHTFSGNIGGYPQLQDALVRYEQSKEELIPWEDPNTIINLSLQTLIADAQRAFSHETYGALVKRNFITVDEFQRVLERLYENNFVLVRINDFIETTTAENGTVSLTYKPLLLPEGKKPIVLTQTNVNYNLYLVDTNDDLIADEGGVGIASKLILDNTGNVTCEMVNGDGTITTGAYDLIPILDAFVEKHPDFSYHGSKAILALTGYNGLFGYRTNAEAREQLGEEQYAQDVSAIQAIAKALTDSGYDLACYTYGNNAYGNYSLAQIQSDMNQWNDEVVPILGTIDTMVFAQNSDINSGMLYSGEKFDYLKSIGFNFYVGYCTDGDPFTFVSENYIRQGRLHLTEENLQSNPSSFTSLFSIEGLLDTSRNN